MLVGGAMALPMTLVAGVLMFSGVQASDIADGSKSHGFLSKYMPSRSQSSQSFIGDSGKFMAHYLNHMQHGGRPEAVGASRTSTDLEPQMIADKDEDKDVQKLFANESKMPVGLCAMAVAFLSLAAMVGVRMRRGMQPPIALASSGGPGIDMSVFGEVSTEAHGENCRESAVQHGRAALTAVFFASPHQPKLAAPTRLFSAVERGTSVLEDTEGLGAEFEGELIDDAAWDTEESGDEDLLAGFDLENADVGEIKEWSITPREVCVQERAEAKAEFRRHDKDCGSSEVQIALFTARIKHITDHVISNPKDHASRRGLLALVSKRRRLINYLYSRDAAKAKKLTDDLGIRFRFKSAMPDRTEKYRQYTIAANKKMKR